MDNFHFGVNIFTSRGKFFVEISVPFAPEITLSSGDIVKTDRRRIANGHNFGQIFTHISTQGYSWLDRLVR